MICAGGALRAAARDNEPCARACARAAVFLESQSTMATRRHKGTHHGCHLVRPVPCAPAASAPRPVAAMHAGAEARDS